MKHLLSRHPVAGFFVLACAATWIVELPLVLSETGLGLLPFALPVEPVGVLATVVGPTLSAFVVTAATEGRPGARALLGRCLRWRVGLGWYLFALLGVPTLLLLSATVWLGAAPLDALVERWPLLFTAFLPAVLFSFVVFIVWEEIGWMGFALPRLQHRYGPLIACAILGPLWALWHLPEYFIGPELAGRKLGLGDLDELVLTLGFYMLMFIPVRVIFTWLFNNTQGTVIVVALLHASFNASSGVILRDLVPGIATIGLGAFLVAMYGVWVVGALLVIGLTKGRLSHESALA